MVGAGVSVGRGAAVGTDGGTGVGVGVPSSTAAGASPPPPQPAATAAASTAPASSRATPQLLCMLTPAADPARSRPVAASVAFAPAQGLASAMLTVMAPATMPRRPRDGTPVRDEGDRHGP